MTLQEVVQSAVSEYNNWASSKGQGSRREQLFLRGIFYNKLLTELNDIPEFKTFRNRNVRRIHPEDIICQFDGVSLKSVDFILPNFSYCNQDRMDIMIKLKSSVPRIKYGLRKENVSYECLTTSIIESIKNFQVIKI